MRIHTVGDSVRVQPRTSDVFTMLDVNHHLAANALDMPVQRCRYLLEKRREDVPRWEIVLDPGQRSSK